MTPTDYRRVLEGTLEQILQIERQQKELAADKDRLLQFAAATLNMLKEQEQAAYREIMEALERRAATGLTDAIRGVLQTSDEWLSAVQVRNRLVEDGFDFGGYTSNPLASIHTVLKRLTPNEAESRETEGFPEYRWKRPKSAAQLSAQIRRGGTSVNYLEQMLRERMGKK